MPTSAFDFTDRREFLHRMAAAAVVGGPLLDGGLGPSDGSGNGRPMLRADELAFDVRAFGAKGDGASDDTQAIQAAVTASDQVSGVVVFPPGHYLISRPIHITGSTTISGTSQYDCRVIPVSSGGFVVNKCNGVRFANIGIALKDRYTDVDNSLIGIEVLGDFAHRPSNHVYEDIYIDGFEIAFQASHLWSSRFSGFKSNNGLVALKISGLSVNNVVNQSSLGVVGRTGSTGLDFTGDVPTEGWVVTDTLIFDADVGIHGVSTAHVIVSGCIIDHCRTAGILLDDGPTGFSGNWSISNSYIAMSGSTGRAGIAHSSNRGAAQNSGNRIIGNYILAYPATKCRAGIDCSASQSVGNIIAGNTVRGFLDCDIRATIGGPLANVIAANTCQSDVGSNIIGGDIVVGNTGRASYEMFARALEVGGVRCCYGTTVPRSGQWNVGDLVFNTLPTIQGPVGAKYVTHGWRRITAGTGNLLNADWVEIRSPTGM